MPKLRPERRNAIIDETEGEISSRNNLRKEKREIRGENVVTKHFLMAPRSEGRCDGSFLVWCGRGNLGPIHGLGNPLERLNLRYRSRHPSRISCASFSSQKCRVKGSRERGTSELLLFLEKKKRKGKSLVLQQILLTWPCLLTQPAECPIIIREFGIDNSIRNPISASN